MIKKLIVYSICALTILFAATPALAHVVVKPSVVETATFQTFSVGVQSEKDNPTIALRLVIPSGLKFVSPNVKPGWTIEVKKQGDGENAQITEITWAGGNIPSGQRDEFLFNAQAPAAQTTLHWNAYQTYQDASTVSWDHNPSTNPQDDAAPPPYSITSVVNSTMQPQVANKNENLFTDFLAAIGFICGASALYLQLRQKR